MKDSELRMIETMLKKQDELNSAIWLVTILYPIILPILLYFELKRFVKELRKNIKE